VTVAATPPGGTAGGDWNGVIPVVLVAAVSATGADMR